MNKNQYQDFFRLGAYSTLGAGYFFESIIEIIYLSILDLNDVAIDGGANHGRHTIPMSKIVGENGLVISFEAIPQLSFTLAEKILDMKIKNVLIKSMAIGSPDSLSSTVEFHYVQELDGWSGIKERPCIPQEFKKSVTKIVVPLNSLDSEIDEQLRIRFIKLDLEGGEFHALKGAQRIMTKDKPFIIFENGRDEAATLYDYTSEDWFALFNDLDYELFDLFGRQFSPSCWMASDIPWYFIAVSRHEDKHFVTHKLPHIIDLVFKNFKVLLPQF